MFPEGLANSASSVTKSVRDEVVTGGCDAGSDVLVAAGVDMSVKISLDLNDAKTDELLSALCEPAKLKYETSVQGATILPP